MNFRWWTLRRVYGNRKKLKICFWPLENFCFCHEIFVAILKFTRSIQGWFFEIRIRIIILVWWAASAKLLNVNEKSQGKVFNCESVESKIYVWQVISKYLSKVYKRTSILLSMTREILNFSKKTLGTKEKRALKNSVYRQSPHEYTLVWQTFKVLLCFYPFIV